LPRCEDGSALRDGAYGQGAWPADPDYLTDLLEELAHPWGYDPSNRNQRKLTRTRRAFECCWPLQFTIDPEAQEQYRLRQIVYLGRYGRQSMRWADWWDCDLEEFDQLHQELSEFITRENAANRTAENHD
jgi:hypothetical protein